MISESVKIQHEMFVSGYNGSSPMDIILTLLPVIPGTALAVSFTQDQNVLTRLCIEFGLCVLPIILNFTYMSESTLEVNVIMILCFFARRTYFERKKVNTFSKEVKNEKLIYLTSCRATVNLATIIAILAVDFHLFPRRFVKTEKYGYSLMDIGAACYVFMNAITDNRQNKINRHIIRDVLFLLTLGFLRLIAVSATNYQHHVTEYGLHCNFFFTLAAIKVICCIAPLFSLKTKISLGTAMAYIHHNNLNSGLAQWTLSEEPRDNFLAANREWIVSLPGFVEIYLFGAATGEYIFTRRPSLYRLGALSVVPFFLLIIMEEFMHCHSSRRLANPSFLLWTVGFFLLYLSLYRSLEHFFLQTSPCLIFEAINSNALPFFLLGNLVTGIININLNTLEVGNLVAFLIINLYVSVVISLIVLLHLWKERRVKGKVS